MKEKIIEKGSSFIYIAPLRVEISWWKRGSMGFFVLPSVSLCKTGNTKGFKIHIGKYTVDFAKFNNNGK